MPFGFRGHACTGSYENSEYIRVAVGLWFKLIGLGFRVCLFC